MYKSTNSDTAADENTATPVSNTSNIPLQNTSTTQEIQLQQTTCRCNLTTRTFFHSLFQTTNLSEKSSKVKCIFLYSMNAVKGAKSKTYFSVTYNSVDTLILLVTFVFWLLLMLSIWIDGSSYKEKKFLKEKKRHWTL